MGSIWGSRLAVALVAVGAALAPAASSADTFIIAKLIEQKRYVRAAQELATLAAELVLAAHCAWSGRGKWLIRALRRFDPERAERLAQALEAYYRAARKDELIAFVDDALAPVGGRFFSGYSSGKDEEQDGEAAGDIGL